MQPEAWDLLGLFPRYAAWVYLFSFLNLLHSFSACILNEDLPPTFCLPEACAAAYRRSLPFWLREDSRLSRDVLPLTPPSLSNLSVMSVTHGRWAFGGAGKGRAFNAQLNTAWADCLRAVHCTTYRPLISQVHSTTRPQENIYMWHVWPSQLQLSKI